MSNIMIFYNIPVNSISRNIAALARQASGSSAWGVDTKSIRQS